MTAPKNPNRALVVALLTAALTQETVLLATMQAALQALAAVKSPPHTGRTRTALRQSSGLIRNLLPKHPRGP